MMVNLQSLATRWNAISRYGTSVRQDYPTRRRVVMLNQSAMLGGAISLVYLLLSAVYAPIKFWPMLVASPFLMLGTRRCPY